MIFLKKPGTLRSLGLAGEILGIGCGELSVEDDIGDKVGMDLTGRPPELSTELIDLILQQSITTSCGRNSI